MSSPESGILFDSLVICDDVRFENNGKLLLIGVYSDVVQVVKLPLQMRSLGLAIKARVMSTGRYPFAVSVADPQGNQLLDANGELNYEGEPGRTIWFPVVMGPALLTTEGAYAVRPEFCAARRLRPQWFAEVSAALATRRHPAAARFYPRAAFKTTSKVPRRPFGCLTSSMIRCGSSEWQAGPHMSCPRYGSPLK